MCILLSFSVTTSCSNNNEIQVYDHLWVNSELSISSREFVKESIKPGICEWAIHIPLIF